MNSDINRDSVETIDGHKSLFLMPCVCVREICWHGPLLGEFLMISV